MESSSTAQTRRSDLPRTVTDNISSSTVRSVLVSLINTLLFSAIELCEISLLLRLIPVPQCASSFSQLRNEFFFNRTSHWHPSSGCSLEIFPWQIAFRMQLDGRRRLECSSLHRLNSAAELSGSQNLKTSKPKVRTNIFDNRNRNFCPHPWSGAHSSTCHISRVHFRVGCFVIAASNQIEEVFVRQKDHIQKSHPH